MPPAARSAPLKPGPGEPSGSQRKARPVATHRLTLASNLAAVGEASEWLRGLAGGAGLDAEDTYRVDLCAGELLTNIVEYAYEDRAPHSIELGAAMDDREIRLEIADDGLPFDPVTHRLVRPPDLLSEARWGGWGLRLVRQFADECRYERRGNRNIVSLVLRRRTGPHVARGIERRRTRGAAVFPLHRSDGAIVHADARSGLDRRVLGFISQLEIFHDVPYALVEGALAASRIQRFPDGALLRRPGEQSTGILFVLSGRVRVHLDAPDSGRFFTIEAGACVGELSVIDGRPASAYVVADAGCRILFVDADTLFDRLLPIPEVNRKFMVMLTERVRRTSERVLEQTRSAMELQHLQRELGLAQEIQAGMLPQESSLFPERTDVECAARIRVARQVGGDFYDAFFIDQTRLLVTIGDVCGKGMPAALLMVRAVTLLRSEATRRTGAKRGQLQRMVERLNQQLAERNEASLFVTTFCALLDTATGKLMFVNAGHNLPLLALGHGSFELLSGPRNPVAGFVGTLTYSAGEVALPPGSTLVLYTDGVIDAQAAGGELFGEQRLLDTLNGAPVRGATQLVEGIMAALDGFAGGAAQADDIAVLALRYAGP
jgi:serine phosphatase RsbU (regulator of sigma subunit)/anti-sigma regulatory factor (Ser/Thr protein kinase)